MPIVKPSVITTVSAGIQSQGGIPGVVRMYYAERLFLAADMACIATFGGDPAQCRQVVKRVVQAYPPAGDAAPACVRSAKISGEPDRSEGYRSCLVGQGT